MILLLAGIIIYIVVSIMTVALFASAKGEDTLRAGSFQRYQR